MVGIDDGNCDGLLVGASLGGADGTSVAELVGIFVHGGNVGYSVINVGAKVGDIVGLAGG